jgi:hypothetical protein
MDSSERLFALRAQADKMSALHLNGNSLDLTILSVKKNNMSG